MFAKLDQFIAPAQQMAQGAQQVPFPQQQAFSPEFSVSPQQQQGAQMSPFMRDQQAMVDALRGFGPQYQGGATHVANTLRGINSQVANLPAAPTFGG